MKKPLSNQNKKPSPFISKNNTPLIEKTCDILVIGAGSAGLSFTYVASQLGLNVILVESNKMGGDCLNSGCVPSKALLSFAKRVKNINQAKKYGIQASLKSVNINFANNYIKKVINKIKPNDSIERYQKFGADVITGLASFNSNNSATVVPIEKSSSRKTNLKNKALVKYNIKFNQAIIATGASPTIPDIKGLIKAKPNTNETIFSCKSKPKHLVVIGAGPIGLEMAQAFNDLGCKVTVLEVAPSILINDDEENAEILRKILISQKINIKTKIKINSVEKTKLGYSVSISEANKKLKLTSSHLLVAAGRAPDLETLNLDSANIEKSGRFIKVDKRLRTSNKRIFAIGDVNGISPFTHMASYQASIALQNILFKIPKKIEDHFVPWVTYTSPEVAQVGLTYLQASKLYGNLAKQIKFDLKDNDRLVTDDKNYGQIKIILYKNKVIGASIIGENAGELILIWGLVIKEKIKLSKVAALIAPYPTLSEVNKRVAASFFTDTLFSKRTKRIVSFLYKF